MKGKPFRYAARKVIHHFKSITLLFSLVNPNKELTPAIVHDRSRVRKSDPAAAGRPKTLEAKKW
jgi:hypothetical protein